MEHFQSVDSRATPYEMYSIEYIFKKQKLTVKNKTMTEEIQAIPQESLMAHFTKHRGNEEMAFAFLLALTPLAVLTFFGQAGLL